MYNDDDLIRLRQHIGNLFEERELAAIYRGEKYVRTPFTDVKYYVWDEEHIAKLKRVECNAVAANKWFRETAPPWARAIGLPLSIADRQKLTQDENLRPNLVGHYGFSLMMVKYDYQLHPSIADCCSGVLAHKGCPDYLHAKLQEFRPRPLEGLEVWWETGFVDFLGGQTIKVLAGFSWSSLEMIASELQSAIRGRQRWCNDGVDGDYLHEWDENIAFVSQRARECYPS